MFFYLLHDETRLKEWWAGRHICPVCNRRSDFSLQRTFRTMMCLFFPFLTMIDDRYIVCESCGYSKKLRIRAYNKIKAHEEALLKQGRYPRERIEIDFHPDQHPIAGKIFRLIFSIAWSILWLILAVFLAIGSGVGGIVGGVLLWAVNNIPFYLACKSIMPDLIKRSVYKEKMKYPLMSDYLISMASATVNEIAGLIKVEEVSGKVLERVSGDNTSEIPVRISPNSASLKTISSAWLVFGAIFMAVSWSFLRKKEIRNVWAELTGKKYKVMLTVASLCLMLAVVCILGAVYAGLTGDEESIGVLVMLGICLIAVFIPFTIVNRVNSGRVIKSLEMLVRTRNYGYINEVMPYIGKTLEKYIFTEHLLYDVASRCILAYSEILWAYMVTDEDGNMKMVLWMSDGRRYSAQVSTVVFREFLKRKPHIIVGQSKENEMLYRQKVAELSKYR